MNKEFLEPVLLVAGTLALLFVIHFFAEKMKTHTSKATVVCCKTQVPMNGFADVPYPKNTIKFILDNKKSITFQVDMKTMRKVEELKNKSGTLKYKGARFIEFKTDGLCVAACNDFF